MRRVFSPTLALFGACAACCWAGAGWASAQTYTETAEVVAVELPVQVVVDGQPVRGLTRESFEIYDGRKKQEITGFEVLDLASPEAQSRPERIPLSARRHFLMLFDLANSEPKSIVKARAAATKLVLDSLHPTDLVAVGSYASSTGPQLVLGFTPDRSQVEKAVETLGVPELVDRTTDPLRLVAAEFKDQLQNAPRGDRNGNRARNDAIYLELLEQATRAETQADRQDQERKVRALSRGLSDLAKLMNSVEGRKYVVYLSEGFDSSLARGTSDAEEASDLAEAGASGNIWEVDSDQRFGSTESANDVERMLEEFRRADCAIQAVDIGGLRTEGGLGNQRASGRDSLFQMAKDTGGELYENFNDLGVAMDQMLKRTGVTYVLSFQPDKLKFDGSFHRLKVELKDAPRGARVVYRPGFYAPRPYAERSPFEKLLEASNDVMGQESGSLATAVLAAPFSVGAEKAYVPVVIEVDGKSLLAGRQAAALPAEIYVYAMDAQGAIRDFFTQTVGLDRAKVEGALRQSGLKFFGHLDLPPGDYSLRVLVRNGTTGQSGLRVVPVTVPAFGQSGAAGGTGARAVLLPPFFPEPAGKWLMVRETPRGEQKEVPYPFMLKQQPYIPASRPVLTPGHEAQVSLVGYNLGAGDLQAAAKVVAADGKEVEAGDLKVLEREAAASGQPDRLVATYRAPKLRPGEYRLVVTVTGASGTVETSTPFAVVG